MCKLKIYKNCKLVKLYTGVVARAHGKIRACARKFARALTIVSKFGGGGDDSVLWLSFAEQKIA
jgi:ribosomal protein L35AE/L33A